MTASPFVINIVFETKDKTFSIWEDNNKYFIHGFGKIVYGNTFFEDCLAWLLKHKYIDENDYTILNIK